VMRITRRCDGSAEQAKSI